jgi:hypothetical protein
MVERQIRTVAAGQITGFNNSRHQSAFSIRLWFSIMYDTSFSAYATMVRL